MMVNGEWKAHLKQYAAITAYYLLEGTHIYYVSCKYQMADDFILQIIIIATSPTAASAVNYALAMNRTGKLGEYRRKTFEISRHRKHLISLTCAESTLLTMNEQIEVRYR